MGTICYQTLYKVEKNHMQKIDNTLHIEYPQQSNHIQKRELPRFTYRDQRENKMLFYIILVAMAPLCLAKLLDIEEVIAMFEALQVRNITYFSRLLSRACNF